MSILKPIKGGRMYPGWWRWNPIGGCEHGCSYCYMLAMQKRTGRDMTTPVFREDYLKDNLGSGRKIAVCLSGDMWGEWVESAWILRVLEHCRDYPDNEYMFLTKNPGKYRAWKNVLPAINCILGTTVETDIGIITAPVSCAVHPAHRLYWLGMAGQVSKTMISIEPVMKFSPSFASSIKQVSPTRVYIGADSGHNGLPEPSADELRDLIAELETFTQVIQKKGLDRLLKA